MKTILTILTGLLFTMNLFGQDSITKNRFLIGVYAKEKEFLERKPSIAKAFKIVPNLDISFSEIDSKMDTVEMGITYQFLDSTQKHKNAFGFCDGTDIYLGNNKYGYTKMDYIGRFSFIASNYNFGRGAVAKVLTTALPVNLPSALLYTYQKNISRRYLFFVNKSGDLHEATGQAIGWFLKDDKDFFKEFNAEKKYNNEVFKKYLMKMNERYPES